MATSMLDFLNYDLSNTDLADAVKHARQTKAQTKANKAKWSIVNSQVKEWSFHWVFAEDPGSKEIEELYNTYKPEDFGKYWHFTATNTLSEFIDNANEDQDY